MARNGGVFIRRTLLGIGSGIGNGSYGSSSFQVLRRLHNPKFFPICIQTLKAPTSLPTTPSLSMSIHITSTPKSLVLLDSLHFLQHRRRLSSAPGPSPFPSPSQSPSPSLAPAPAIKFPRPADIVFLWTRDQVERAIQKVQDEGFRSVPSDLPYTARRCQNSQSLHHPAPTGYNRALKGEWAYFGLPVPLCFLCLQRRMLFLGLKSPTFQFYLDGEKVEEISTGSIKRVITTFENVYSPSGMKKRRRRQGPKEVKNEEEVDPSKLSKVLPNRFPASAYPKVMEAVESLPEAKPLSELWWFAKGLFTSDEKRERFCELEDDRAKLEWLHCEMAE